MQAPLMKIFRAFLLLFLGLSLVWQGGSDPAVTSTRHRRTATSDLNGLVQAFEQAIRQAQLDWPGRVGYVGWNYETAAVLYAMQVNLDLNLTRFDTTRAEIHTFLEGATQFPQPGFWPWFAPWVFTPGDRIGLFGSLYNYYDTRKSDTILSVIQIRLKFWPRKLGVYARIVGWGFLQGVSPFSRFLWIDDSFMGGQPLLEADPRGYGDLLLTYHQVFRDDSDSLYWHALQIGLFGEATANGVKWARGNSWLLLSMSFFLLYTRDNTEVSDLRMKIASTLNDQINNLVAFQRPSGAFGNIINDASSAEETSLTSVFVFAASILDFYGLVIDNDVREAGQMAWMFVEARATDPAGFALESTAGSQWPSTNPDDYANNIGMSSGPGPAVALYAMLGSELLGFT